MNATTYKEGAMTFVRDVATQKAARLQEAHERQKEMTAQMHYLHKKQMQMKDDLMHKSFELKKNLQNGTRERLRSFHMFQKQLAEEGQARQEDRDEMAEEVCQFIGELQNDMKHLRHNLKKNADNLHNKLHRGEQQRLAEAQKFMQMLNDKHRECFARTKDLMKQTQQFLKGCHTSQFHMARDLRGQFADFRSAREEIQSLWMSMAGMPFFTQKKEQAFTDKAVSKFGPGTAKPSNFEKTSGQCKKFDTDGKGKFNLKSKIKSLLETTPGGMKVPQLQRKLSGTSRDVIRHTLNELVSGHEIRKGRQEKFFAI